VSGARLANTPRLASPAHPSRRPRLLDSTESVLEGESYRLSVIRCRANLKDASRFARHTFQLRRNKQNHRDADSSRVPQLKIDVRRCLLRVKHTNNEVGTSDGASRLLGERYSRRKRVRNSNDSEPECRGDRSHIVSVRKWRRRYVTSARTANSLLDDALLRWA
jgi:hypothetical protein